MHRTHALLIAALAVVVALAPPAHAAGGTTVTITDSTLIVTAGAPGSLTLTDRVEPGGGGGPVVWCGWFDVVIGGSPVLSIIDVVDPVEGATYLLDCWTETPEQPLAGYPIAAVFRHGGPLPGPAVSTAEAARHAIDSIVFQPPVAALSPPDTQVVGVPTWLAVTSALDYEPASAQAGPVWATVRPALRDVTWDMGNGDVVRCESDVATRWTPGAPDSDCSYTYSRGANLPLPATVTIAWVIHQRTDKSGGTWQEWGTIRMSAPVPVTVTDIQAAIR